MKTRLLVVLTCMGLSAAARGQMQLQCVRQLPERKIAWRNTSRMRRDAAYPLASQGGLLLIAR